MYSPAPVAPREFAPREFAPREFAPREFAPTHDPTRIRYGVRRPTTELPEASVSASRSEDPTSDLTVVSPAPFNAETRLEAQVGIVTPAGRHYVRNHFAVPSHDGTLHIDGNVARALTIRVADLWPRATTTALVTLECAGNGRASLVPPAPGEQWGIGAVGTADWTGIPLADLLAEAGPLPDTAELVFAGADEGLVGAVGRVMSFERSMPIAEAGRALVILGMNGNPLTPNHGAPVRLLVPGRYGMASVKWLSRITAIREPFRGFFQVDRYVVDGVPLGPIAPRAVIASPAAGASLSRSATTIRGYAWSGRAAITRVDVSTDGGATRAEATLGPEASQTAWREWQIPWHPADPGEHMLLAAATDATGARQPLAQVRTDLGYGNNAAQPVTVRVD